VELDRWVLNGKTMLLRVAHPKHDDRPDKHQQRQMSQRVAGFAGFVTPNYSYAGEVAMMPMGAVQPAFQMSYPVGALQPTIDQQQMTQMVRLP